MNETATPWRTNLATAFTMIAGVGLPVAAIAIELMTDMCAAEFFDPVPTVWHILLAAFVPLANLQVWLALRRGRTERPALLGYANAAATGVALYYTTIFLSITPLAVIAIAFAGMGLLPLAPLLSLIAALMLRRRLRELVPAARASGWKALVAGVAASLLLLALIEIPATATRVGMAWAASGKPERMGRGMKLLRTLGSEEHVLRACYERSGQAADPIGFLFTLDDPTSLEEARGVYYRLTGRSFDSVPAPRLAGRFDPTSERNFDPEQGGEVVAGKLKGLSLAGSRLDGSLDADAALGYVEWTLVFKNDAEVQREARAQVQLPPGGVVSRLTLWVNGEEREAAFAGRGKVREAYQNIVRQRRDPVLVTTAGRDRVLVQCFPVAARGGEMKVRLGITVPLKLEDRAHAALRLPYFVERNFDVGGSPAHAVWVESKTPVDSKSDNLRAENPRIDLFAVRGSVSDSELTEPQASVRATRDAALMESRTAMPGGKQGEAIRQTIEETTTTPASRVVLVVDASRQMRSFIGEVADAAAELSRESDLHLVIAGDEVTHLSDAIDSDPARARELMIERLRNTECRGGADNVRALELAWDVAAGRANGTIVWAHAPQPVPLSSVDNLRQRWERRPDGARLVAVAAVNKANRILERLDGVPAVESHTRTSDLRTDLRHLFAELTGGGSRLRLVRDRIAAGEPLAGGKSKEASTHLARLWADDEVRRLAATDEAGKIEEATTLAAKFQIVTPVSGAVVLENAEQYRQAGLTPVDAGSVPTIPEPEVVLLIGVVALVLLWMNRHMLRRAVTR